MPPKREDTQIGSQSQVPTASASHFAPHAQSKGQAGQGKENNNGESATRSRPRRRQRNKSRRKKKQPQLTPQNKPKLGTPMASADQTTVCGGEQLFQSMSGEERELAQDLRGNDGDIRAHLKINEPVVQAPRQGPRSHAPVVQQLYQGPRNEASVVRLPVQGTQSNASVVTSSQRGRKPRSKRSKKGKGLRGSEEVNRRAQPNTVASTPIVAQDCSREQEHSPSPQADNPIYTTSPVVLLRKAPVNSLYTNPKEDTRKNREKIQMTGKQCGDSKDSKSHAQPHIVTRDTEACHMRQAHDHGKEMKKGDPQSNRGSKGASTVGGHLPQSNRFGVHGASYEANCQLRQTCAPLGTPKPKNRILVNSSLGQQSGASKSTCDQEKKNVTSTTQSETSGGGDQWVSERVVPSLVQTYSSSQDVRNEWQGTPAGKTIWRPRRSHHYYSQNN